jgi:tetratricopeptide (TPR) repeat protein
VDHSVDELLEKGSIKNINVTAVSGNEHLVKDNKIEVNCVKVAQITPSSPAEYLPELWMVPTKNLNFIGRSELLKQIEHHYNQNDTPAILTACHGLGGIGKTQVALEFVWQHYKKYNGVVWFNAESRDQLQNEYIILGRERNIICNEENIKAEELARKVKGWFEDPLRAGWLLVYDNVDNFKAISELLPKKGGKILITSRYTADWSQGISIDVFTIKESRDYVLKVLDTPISDTDMMQIEMLAETLGRLPLALAQATAYIKYTKMSISRYLELYRQKKRDLLNSKILSPYYHDCVFITWDITMETIRKESQLALNLLNICACLASNDIPNFLLEKFADTPENNPNSEVFEEALGTLNCYSMLTINRQNCNSSIHHLVQEVIRLKWEKEETQHLMDIFKLLIDSFPYGSQALADYAKIRQLLLHLEAFLPHLDAWRQKEHQLCKETEKDYLCKFQIYIAYGYRCLGNAEKERELLERALAIKERHYGPDHPEVATTLNSLGWAHYKLGETQKSRELLERALAIKERHYGLDLPEVAGTLNNLGWAYYKLGETQKSRELLERALAIKERHYGPDHPEVATTLNSLGWAHYKLGETQKSRELLERALAIKERHYGLDHPEVAITLNNLGNAYGTLGDTKKKRELLERALAINERHYGPDHPEVTSTLANLGNVNAKF